MPDNVTANSGTGGATFAGASLSFSGDTAVFPIGSGAILTGSEGSWTQSLIVGGAGSVTAGTQRVTLASDDPAVSTLSTINGKITACNTGAVVISSGTVAATQSGTWTVGLSAAQTLATVTTVSTVTNLAQLGGVAVAMGSGTRSAGTQRVTIATDDVVPASQSGTWTVGLSAGQTLATVTNLAQLGGAAIAMGSGVRSAGTQRVTIATDDLVPVSIASVPSHPVTNAGTFAVQNDARATGGATASKTVSAASTNATSVKASAGTLYGVQVSNVNAAARYLKLYNKASAPTVGTDTPVKTIVIPGNTAGAGNTIAFPYGVEFTTGIAFALTTEATDAGTTGVAANEIVVNLDYK